MNSHLLHDEFPNLCQRPQTFSTQNGNVSDENDKLEICDKFVLTSTVSFPSLI